MTSWYVDLILLAVTLALLWKLRAGPLRGIMPYVWHSRRVALDRLLSDLAGCDDPGRGSVGFPVVAGDAGHCLDDCRSLSRGRAADAPMVLAARGRKGFSLAGRRPRFFARERGGGIGRRASRLGEALESGLPLDAALAASGARLSTSALRGHAAGCEPGNWRSRARRRPRPPPPSIPRRGLAGSQLAYLFVLVSFAFATITFIQIKLVPEFIKIFDGFGLRLPPMTIVMVNLGQFLISAWAILGSRITSNGGGYALARYVGLVRWEPTLVRHFSRDLDAAIVLRALRLAVDERQPLSLAIASLASHYPQPHVRRRLRRANDMVTSGANWCDSLQKFGLVGPVEVAVLKAAEKIDNLGWASAKWRTGRCVALRLAWRP